MRRRAPPGPPRGRRGGGGGGGAPRGGGGQQGFLLVWLAFVAVAAGAAALEWLLTDLLTFRLLPGGAALFQFALTAGLYPLLATWFIRAHRGLANPEQA